MSATIEHPEVAPYLTEWPRSIEHPPYSERDRMIQRLGCRGRVTVHMEMESTPVQKWAVRGTYSTAFSAHDRPKWIVHVGYRYGNIFASILRWDDVHVEGYDLDDVLREALRKSEPERIALYEAVPARFDALRDMFAVMSGHNYPPSAASSLPLDKGGRDG